MPTRRSDRVPDQWLDGWCAQGENPCLLPDTHAHLDVPELAQNLDGVLARARDAGVDRILAVGSDLDSSRSAVEIARRYDTVYAAVGVHPHEAARFREEECAVRALLCDRKVVAVGEIGLDYYRMRAPRRVQLNAFRRQLEWAAELHLPVSVHNRSADEDVLDVLADIPVTAVLHCFSSSPSVAEKALIGGHYLSFAGIVTFPKVAALLEVVRNTPSDRLLIETDSPVLAPVPLRGRRNEPANLALIAAHLRRTLNVSPRVLATSISSNADRVFAWRAV